MYAKPGHHSMLADASDEGLRRELTLKRFALFAARIPSGRILDVGCGSGTFLGLARRYGYATEGVEADAVRARLASQLAGTEVKTGSFLECELEAHSFDLITFWDVFEHLAEPRHVLQRCRHLLKSGGWVGMLVPNVGSRLALSLGGHWAGWCLPFHLFHYCAETLGQILRQSGFEVVDVVDVDSHWIAEHSLLRVAGLEGLKSGILKGREGFCSTIVRMLASAHFGPRPRSTAEQLKWLRHRMELPAAAADSQIFVLARKSPLVSCQSVPREHASGHQE